MSYFVTQVNGKIRQNLVSNLIVHFRSQDRGHIYSADSKGICPSIVLNGCSLFVILSSKLLVGQTNRLDRFSEAPIALSPTLKV